MAPSWSLVSAFTALLTITIGLVRGKVLKKLLRKPASRNQVGVDETGAGNVGALSGGETVSIETGDYKVFISHCGADCKRDFAIILKNELERVGVRCFFDEESLKVGDKADDKMLEAMQTSEYGIVILSPGFFDRTWCMKELHTFVTRQRIVPIFFSSFEAVENAKKGARQRVAWESFKKYLCSREEVQEALDASYTGLRLEAYDGFWNVCIEKAKNEMLRLLGKLEGGVRLSEEDLLVGQEEHLLKLKMLLGLPMGEAAAGSAAAEIGIVGVKGMGGVGKSTLAKKLYDEQDVRSWFGGNICWLRVGQNPTTGYICGLQSQVLKQLCDLDIKIYSPEEGRPILKERLRGKRVLICLDDVWGKASLTQEVVRIQDLAFGSRILKTTRESQAIDGEIFELDVLDQASAWKLFCWHGFGGEEPPGALADTAISALEKCGGLPLAVRILGKEVGALSNEERKEQCLKKVLNLPMKDSAMAMCLNIISTSYNNLPSPEMQDAFLLIAGLWPHNRVFEVERYMVENLAAAVYGNRRVEERRALAQDALETLADWSLIKLTQERDAKGEDFHRITVHDILVDFAVGLVNAGEPAERKFLLAGSQEKGMEPFRAAVHVRVLTSFGTLDMQHLLVAGANVRSLILDQGVMTSASTIHGDSGCRLLSITGWEPPKSIDWLSNLQCLRLRYCQMEKDDGSLRGIGSMNFLNILEIYGCTGSGVLPSEWVALTGLQTLKIRGGHYLARHLPRTWPGLIGLQHLELDDIPVFQSILHTWQGDFGFLSLALDGCHALKHLQTLSLSSQERDARLPAHWAALTELKVLRLDFNKFHGGLPTEWAALRRLKVLLLNNNCLEGALPVEWADFKRLKVLNLSHNRLTGNLPKEWASLTSLRMLCLSHNMFEGDLPQEWASLTSLEVLELYPNKLSGVVPLEWGAMAKLRRVVLDYMEVPPEWELLVSQGGLLRE